MDRAQKRRWMVLLAGLGATIGAIVYPTEDAVRTAPNKRTETRTVLPAVRQELIAAGSPSWIATDVNPFASKGWQAAPTVTEAVKAAPLPQAAADIPPAPPPPLPYLFVGQMNDGPDRVVYLGRGDQVILARAGDVLESTYKVVTISATQIEFESVASGLKQSLVIPARDN